MSVSQPQDPVSVFGMLVGRVAAVVDGNDDGGDNDDYCSMGGICVWSHLMDLLLRLALTPLLP